MVTSTSPLPVRLVARIEADERLEVLARLIAPAADAVDRSPLAGALRGAGAGHALHPVATDVPIGAWLSAAVLDVVGGRSGRDAARRLVGVGILAAVPTTVTGLAEWQHTDEADGRVGAVHAAGNGVALVLQAASWLARRRGHQGRAVALSTVALAAAGASAYLGGHLAIAKNVGSRDRAYAAALPPDAPREQLT